jgi:hypothetical protein
MIHPYQLHSLRKLYHEEALQQARVHHLRSELLVHRRRYPDREVARSATFEYLGMAFTTDAGYIRL